MCNRSCLHPLSRELMISRLRRSKDLLEDQRSALLASTDLINEYLSADVFKLVARTCWTTPPCCNLPSCSCRLGMTVREVLQNFLSVLVDAVQEEVFHLSFV